MFKITPKKNTHHASKFYREDCKFNAIYRMNLIRAMLSINLFRPRKEAKRRQYSEVVGKNAWSTIFSANKFDAHQVHEMAQKQPHLMGILYARGISTGTHNIAGAANTQQPATTVTAVSSQHYALLSTESQCRSE